MNIWLLQIGEPSPFDTQSRKLRTATMIDHLLARGHQVVWWTSAFDHFQKRWIVRKETEQTLKEGLTVRFLKGIGYHKNVSVARYLDHRLVARQFRKRAPQLTPPDLILASSPSH